ncbi:MAG: glycosyltransferase [Lachnospiraceae bacterium]|nr:glycosyltransferase [Lachnospiraceae bacterium]
MKFLNSIICYNNSDEVVRFIEKMLKIKKEDLSFAVVVNAGTIKDKRALEKLSVREGRAKVSVYIPKKNLGYLNGLLYGYKHFIKEHFEPDYVIFSNTDIEIPDKDFFDKFEARNYSENIGCIGPSVFVRERNAYDNPICDDRRPVEEIDRLVRILSIPVIRGLYVNLSDYKGRITRRNKTESRFVYEVHGCYFILSNRFARVLARKKYGALMYSEEAYIAENIRKYGFKTFYDSDLEVVHLEHSVTKGLKGEGIAKHIRSSMKMIREEFYT